MKGFLKRDFYLLLPNLRFYLVFLAILAALSILEVSNMVDFFGFYLSLFAASSVLGLFSYDEASHWQAYAAAVPDGRRGQVTGRYVLSLLMGLATTGTVAGITALCGFPRSAPMALLYGGMFQLYIDLAIPVGYRFGNNSRVVMVLILAAMGAIMGMGGAALTLTDMGGAVAGKSLGILVGIPLLAVGIVGVLPSRSISLKIMERKQL